MTKCLNLRCVSTFLLIFFILPGYLSAQFSDPIIRQESKTDQPQDYLFPITPGTPNTLAGTMGELRNTHFHSGLDIRTNNQIGAAVLSAQRGYISRIVKSSWSYGNVIYVTHPDSNTTLYAHLNEFKGKIAEHVRREQYNQKTFEIDLRFGPGDFPVERGDTIALSGNTGSSNGPHLHFDIRDKKMNALNPLDFGFEEIVDKTKPLVQKIALRTITPESRINGKFGRYEFTVYKVGGNYTFLKPILAHGKIGVEVLAYDRMDNSRFQCGINTIEMLADSQRVFVQKINGINMPVTRGILSLFDYKTLKNSGFRFNKLFVEDGNPLQYYEGTVNRGYLNVEEKDVPVLVKLGDSYNNFSNLTFTLKHDPVVVDVPTFSHGLKPLAYGLEGNILQVTGMNCKDSTAKFFIGDEVIPIKPAYKSASSRVYLYDIRKGVPDSVQSCNELVRMNFHDMVPSGTDYTYYSKNISISFPDSALFDTLYLAVRKNDKRKAESILIGDETVPLMRDIKVDWMPDRKYNSPKFSVYRANAWGGYANLGGKWESGKVTFTTREFGEFLILPDSVAPGILRIACTSGYARFKISDDLSGIFSFEATINGNWLLMNYDHKTGVIYSEKLDRKIPLKGDFQLKVTDYAGNEKIYKQKIL
jgi:hypothetical protein